MEEFIEKQARKQGNQQMDDQLAATKHELRLTQVRLHQLQETSVAEAAFLQLRAQYFQVQYELWVMKAYVAWASGEQQRMADCLKASLDCITLAPEEIIADWLRRLDQFSKPLAEPLDKPRDKPRSSTLAAHIDLTLAALVNEPVWRSLVEHVLAQHSPLH